MASKPGKIKNTLQCYAETNRCPGRFLLKVMHDEGTELSVRVDAAKALMPYVHRKLPQELETKGLNLAAIHLHF